MIRQIGPGDALIEIEVPRHWRQNRPDLPRRWILREICYTPPNGQEEIRLFTSLGSADEMSAEEIAATYHERWAHETGIGEFKTRRGMVTTITRPVLLRSMTPERVE